ncbi:MAG: S8 family serine peptidase, partial [Pyrinomonadaceae bacterium]
SANNIDDMSTSSSRGPGAGPGADSRIKPDISAPGIGISGGRSGSDSLFGNIDANHRWSSGTSHAAPMISGMAALFTNYWMSTRFGDRPSPALLKAAIINSGQDMNGNLSSAPIPNGNEGWGRANTRFMLNTGVGMKYIDEEVPLSTTGDTFGSFAGSVADSTKPVRVTLVWTDPPGVADPALVNNLDLVVTIGGNVYKGNVLSNGLSVTGGAADTRNNVENVLLPAGIPAGTSFSISVVPTALNGDGILGNGDFTDQAYALAIYNYSPQAAPSFYSLSGQLRSPSGRGIASAKVRIADSQGVVRETISNHFGYFSFVNVAGGQTHTISVTSKRYTFPQQTVSVNSNLANVNFVSSFGSP